jgi:hypothetical protein
VYPDRSLTLEVRMKKLCIPVAAVAAALELAGVALEV